MTKSRLDSLRREMSLFAAMLVTAMPAIVIAQVDPGLEVTKPWVVCLAEKARALSRSPDDASTVAAAAITLCSSFEGPVRVALDRSTVKDLVRRGVAFDEAEADRVVRSIGNRGWQGYMANMSAHVTAMVVEMRANMDRPKKQVAE